MGTHHAGPHMRTSFGEGWAVVEDIGGRAAMEDTHVMNARIAGGARLFAVFDGHNGGQVARHCADRSAAVFSEEMARSSSGTGHAITSAIGRLDREGRESGTLRMDVGSTACVIVLTADEVWAGNVGDSRAVMMPGGPGRAKALTEDHKPTVPREMRRIHDHGGHLTRSFGDTVRINGGLNLSRSIGDWHMRPLVISTPDVTRTARTTGRRDVDEFLIIASDGLWDVVTDEEAAAAFGSCLHSRKSVGEALVGLVNESRRRGSTDNVTIAYVGLSRRSCGRARPRMV